MTIEAILHRDWYLEHDNLSVNLAALNTKYKLPVIGRPIVSVFPEFEDIEDEAPLHYFYNRILYPQDEADWSNVPAIVMWTKASPLSTQIASHFIPVFW